MLHTCDKEGILNIIHGDIREMRKDVKHLLKSTSALKVKMGIISVFSGTMGGVVVLLVKMYGG